VPGSGGGQRDRGVGGAVVGARVERPRPPDAGGPQHVGVARAAAGAQRAGLAGHRFGRHDDHPLAGGAQQAGESAGDERIAADHDVPARVAGAHPAQLGREQQPARLDQRVDGDRGGAEPGDVQGEGVRPTGAQRR
jgi:hypothetical protein